jgi:hypothetical protein
MKLPARCLLLAMLAACSKKQPEAAPSPDAATSTLAASASAPAASAPSLPAAREDTGPPITGRNDPRFNALALFSKLEVERANRPSTLRSDTVFDAVAKSLNAPLDDRKQVAAYPVLASYCEKATTAASVAVVVCEYPDAATMAQGQDIASKMKIPHRDFVRAQTTWISVTPLAEGPAGAAEAKKVLAAVKGIPAKP